MDANETNLLARVDALTDWLTANTRELVAIPTVNPFSGDPDAVGEAAGQDWIETRFRELGATVRRVPVPADIYARTGVPGTPGRHWKGRENVVAEWTFGPGGPAILLNTHMDTVGTAGMTIPPFEPVLKDGCIYGRGSSDSKGNLALGLTAVRALIEAGELKRGRVIFASVVDEECSGSGAGTLACCEAGITGDAALVLDGGRGLAATGCNGIATAWLTVRGRAGHSSLNTSVSAIDKGILVKGAIDAFMADYAGRHPGCGGTVGVFRAGALPSTVPGEAVLGVNLKYALADAREAEEKTGAWGAALFRERFQAWLAGALKGDAWLAEHPPELAWTTDMYPFDTGVDHPVVRTAVESAAAATGAPIRAGFMPAWFDGARLSRRLRIPVVGLGHGEAGQAHTATERVRIEDLMAGARTVALTLSRLLKQG